MVQFIAPILQFDEKAEKTGWTYIEIPASVAAKIKPGTKTSFRVKGKLDDYSFAGLALTPMGGGDFILALKASIRKAIHKSKGATIKVSIAHDEQEYELNTALMECLKDEPGALAFFKSLPRGHQNYFSKWIESAKTDITRAKRIAMTVTATAKKWGYSEMIRAAKKDKFP